MKISITTKNITLDEPLRVFVEAKIGNLAKFFKGKDDSEARVEIGKPSEQHRKGPVFYAEVNLKTGGVLLRGESEHVDLRSAITKVEHELQVQIKKLKNKAKDLSRRVKK